MILNRFLEYLPFHLSLRTHCDTLTRGLSDANPTERKIGFLFESNYLESPRSMTFVSESSMTSLRFSRVVSSVRISPDC
jgi:hypothetical protein